MMSEWWTYSLTSFLLFSPRTYYRLFELHNAQYWPLQPFTMVMGFAILARTIFPAPWGGRIIAVMLALLWAIVAWTFLLQRYDQINFAARYFAAGFALQAALLFFFGVIRDDLRAASKTVAAKVGIGLIGYALVLHPLIAPLSGRPWMQAELFGLAPDPTVILTLGVLTAAARPSWLLLSFPLLWCIVSGLTLWTMELPEAPAILVAGLLTVVARVVANRGEFPRAL